MTSARSAASGAAPDSPIASPAARSSRTASATSASVTVTVPWTPSRSVGHAVAETSAQSRPAIVVPGVGTLAGAPAASEAVRHAAVTGSTPISVMPACAANRAAAAPSEPTPIGTSRTSNVPCSPSSAKSVA